MRCGLVSVLAAAGQGLLWECSAALSSGVRGLVIALMPPPWLRQRGRPGSDGSLSLGPSPRGRRVPSLLGHRQCLLCRDTEEGADDMASGMAVFVTSQLVSSQISFLDLTLSVVPSDCLQAVIYPSLSGAISAPALFGQSFFWRQIPRAPMSLLLQLQVPLLQALPSQTS